MWSASWSRLLLTPLLIPSAFSTILVSSARFSLPSLSRRAISCATPEGLNAGIGFTRISSSRFAFQGLALV